MKSCSLGARVLCLSNAILDSPNCLTLKMKFLSVCARISVREFLWESERPGDRQIDWLD